MTQKKLTHNMQKLIIELKEIVRNPVVESAYNDAIANVQPILSNGKKNPWVGKDINYFIKYFEDWFTFLPLPDDIKEKDEKADGLGFIEPFTNFYLNNKNAYYFLNNFKSAKDGKNYTTEIFDWTVKFIIARGKFMDSPESLKHLDDWMNDPSTKIEQFIVPKGGFKSFNEFFIRELNQKLDPKPRPIFEEKDDSIITAPADSEINFIQTDLTLTTQLNVKTRQLNVSELLNGSDYAKNFVGGTAVSCVLMPGSYHRYHSPTNGYIVESAEVPGIYNGVMDGEHWFNKGNIGESTTDFSIFEDFHRAYYIIKTTIFGYVAMVPVGLNTISALSFNTLISEESTLVPKGSAPVKIEKGKELGHFAYGGSLNILLFEPGVFQSVSVLMGQRIGSLNKAQKHKHQKTKL